MKRICKHCNSNKGYYIKNTIYGSSNFHYSANGEYLLNGENSAIYDHLEHREGKNAYCINCDKVMFKTEELNRD